MKQTYVFAGNSELLQAKSSSNKKLLNVSDLRLKLRHMRLHSVPNSLQELRDAHLLCSPIITATKAMANETNQNPSQS